LTDLFSLGLDYNQISDITPLVGLTGLIRLYLG
jgi:Leucine-rich repeat (LRR) protein